MPAPERPRPVGAPRPTAPVARRGRWLGLAMAVLALLGGVLARTQGTSSASGPAASAGVPERSKAKAPRTITTKRFATTTVASTRAAPMAPSTTSASNRTDPRLRLIGFTSRSKLHDHYVKHGREFGRITEAQYLAMAQDLRDAPLSKRVIETEQVGGTISRFDRSTGAFIAFNPDLTIRTFFKPDDGEDYFWRAAKRSH